MLNPSLIVGESLSRLQITTVPTSRSDRLAFSFSKAGRLNEALFDLSMYQRTVFGLMRLLLSQRLISRPTWKPFAGSRAMPTTSDIIFEAGSGNLLEAPEISFGSGTRVMVIDSGVGQIEAITTWNDGAKIELADSADQLQLLSDSTFESTAMLTGNGLLVNASGAKMTFKDGVDVGVSLQNEGVLEIGSSSGGVSLGGFDQTDLIDVALFTAGLSGDYNNDGTVNAADYTVWRNNLGATTVLPNDATPGTVDGSELMFVPEPTSFLLLAIGFIGVMSSGFRCTPSHGCLAGDSH